MIFSKYTKSQRIFIGILWMSSSLSFYGNAQSFEKIKEEVLNSKLEVRKKFPSYRVYYRHRKVIKEVKKELKSSEKLEIKKDKK